jgi:hypothetical protein
MLHRIIYASEAVGATGTSTLSIAQILGIAERNNRRDDITSCVLFHEGHILQVLEGARVDLDRLLRKLQVDPRHDALRILQDKPVPVRAIDEPMCLCGDPAALLDAAGVPGISMLTANDAERLLDLRRAA